LEEDQAAGKRDEERVLAVEEDLAGKENELKKLKEILKEKRSLAQSKRGKIEQILRDADRLEYRLDEAVGHAEEVTEQQINLPSDEEVSEQVGRPKTVIPSFLKFRRNVRAKPNEEEEEEEEEEDEREGEGKGKGKGKRAKYSNGGREGGLRDSDGRRDSFDEFVKQSESDLHSSEDQMELNRNDGNNGNNKSFDINEDALRALDMQVIDTTRLKGRIESVTAKERIGSFFD
jgi:hypothetical protein